MPHPVPPEQREALAAALYSGRKIEAIKLCREITGLGLAEAKELSERLEGELRAQHPERFTAAPGGKGCAGAILVLGALLAGLLLLTLSFGR